jgi:molybdopterin-guanine dinucleotide biosynthesis protein A
VTRSIVAVTQGTYAAVVLAGGAARRLGGVRKPAVPVAGVPMLLRVLAAVADARPRVVVGPVGLPLPDGVERTLEDPPGGGPVAAAAAGLARVPPEVGTVALLAADLPLLTAQAVRRLREAVDGGADRDGGADGAVYVDRDDRPQWLCGVWRRAALAAAVRAGGPGAALRTVLAPLRVARLRAATPPDQPPPWYDCDTEADLRRVRSIL